MKTANFQILALSMLLGAVNVAAQVGDVTSLVLWDALENKELMVITDGMEICTDPQPKWFSIEARTSASVGSMYMKLEGPVSKEETFNAMPFFMAGTARDAEGNVENVYPIRTDGYAQPLKNGQYTMIAEPYERDNLVGAMGARMEVSFTVNCDEDKVRWFYLWDAYENKEVMELTDGMEFCPTPSLPWFNIQTKATGNIGSIRINLSGPVNLERIDTLAPYFIAGNSLDENGEIDVVFPIKVNDQIQPLKNGRYTLTGAPYTVDHGDGDLGRGKTIRFRVNCPTLCRRC